MPQYRVQLFAILKERVGQEQWYLASENALSGKEILAAFFDANPELGAFRKTTRLAVNQQFAQDNAAVGFKDELALIPPVSGG